MSPVDEQRAAYRNTYQDYAQKLSRLQQIRQSHSDDACTIESAVLELEKARLAYNSARDQLAQSLGGKFEVQLEAQPEPSEHQISVAAHLLWELAGEPEGTAESDWNRAKSLIRCATATARS